MIIRISNLPPYNGDHEVSPPFNAREWRIIKQTSGALPTTLGEAIAGGDPDVVVALVMIALRRKGEIPDENRIVDNYFPGDESGVHARIEVILDDEPDAVPPPSPPSELAQRRSSGISGSDAGDTRQENDPSSTGTPRSDTGAA